MFGCLYVGFFFFSSRRRHTRCALVTGVQTCALPICYRGPAVFIGEAKPNLGLAWPVNSIRVPNGRWELCERTRYRGNCRTVDRDTPMLNNVLRGITVQSIRPVGGGGGGWNPNPPANDQVARGNFAEFQIGRAHV